MCEAPGHLLEGTHEVQTPDYEWPGDRDCLEGLRREMHLSSEELTALAASHDLLGICHRYWPVEALSKGFPDQSSWSRVVAAHSGVDVCSELCALIDQDTSLQDPEGAAPVEFSFDESE